jgi:hypothetical protein
MIVSSYMDPNVGEDIDYALAQIGLSGKRKISTTKSEEATDVTKKSPVNSFKGYPK